MRSLGSPDAPEPPADDPEQDDGYVDVDYKVRKRSRWKDRKKRKNAKELWTIRRVETDYGCGIEYEARQSFVRRRDLPPSARHLTGRKGVFVEVDMLPLFPEYADPDAEKDEDGNWVSPHNYFDAFGYFKWFADQRIKKGYEALGQLHAPRRPIDWKMIGMIAVAAVVALFVAMQFMG